MMEKEKEAGMEREIEPKGEKGRNTIRNKHVKQSWRQR